MPDIRESLGARAGRPVATQSRRRLVAMLAVAALAGCASAPPQDVTEAAAEGAQAGFNTGRVSLTVTDFGGRPLDRARVDIEGLNDHREYFRNAAFSDVFGRVSFNGVPQRVRITVFHAATRASYSQVFDVPPTGITELRMLVDTFGQ
jgi:hypothetical protein